MPYVQLTGSATFGKNALVMIKAIELEIHQDPGNNRDDPERETSIAAYFAAFLSILSAS